MLARRGFLIIEVGLIRATDVGNDDDDDGAAVVTF